MKRRLIAIGDLHGDVHRLVRILQRHDVLLKDRRTWDRNGDAVDLVLLGDYVDWRGEPLEGDKSTWNKGTAELLELIVDLHRQISEMKHNRSRFFCLLGNHDKLMLDSYRHLASLPDRKRAEFAATYSDVRKVHKLVGGGGFLSGLFGSKKTANRLGERVVTWIGNGGPSTINSFGGFDSWYQRMDSGLADFIATQMRLGVVLNDRLYTHTVPDSEKWWRPVGEVEKMGEAERDEAIEEWVWGRRLHGVDHHTGKPVPKPEPAEVDRMLAAMGVKGVVMGHSLMQSLYPVRAYDGKIVNIDFHGHPLSEPWLDQYDA